MNTMNEQHANIWREMRKKVRTVADMYDLSPEEVVRIWLAFEPEAAGAALRGSSRVVAHAEGERA